MDTVPIVRLEGIRIAGLCACVPVHAEDNLARCTAVYGSAAKAESVVKATGIRTRRVLAAGGTALDLCVQAAEDVLARTETPAGAIGAVVSVTFTPDEQMPCSACRAQARLGLARNIPAFDLNLACSGWLYGVYVAGLLARSMRTKVLLLDGDCQTARAAAADAATAPLLADAGTATLIEPSDDPAAPPFLFSFLSDGAQGDALRLPWGGTIAMDGLAVFKFVTMDVLHFIQGFLQTLGTGPEAFDAFVPHQANMFMIGQIARKLGFAPAQLRKSGDVLGNSASASVPVTIAFTRTRGTLLAAGFGGGLSAAVARLPLDGACRLGLTER